MSEMPNEPEALAAVKTLEAISKKLHPGALSGGAYNAVFSALRAAYADVFLATDTIQKVKAWIAEAKPLLERGGKAETALAAAQSRVASLERELAETRAKRDEYDDGQAHWFNEHFKLRVERDALTAENEKLREALTMLHRWCTEDQLDLSREGITRATVLATVTAALHPATKEGKAE